MMQTALILQQMDPCGGRSSGLVASRNIPQSAEGMGIPRHILGGFLVRVPLPVQVLGVFPLILIGMGQSWLSGDTQT